MKNFWLFFFLLLSNLLHADLDQLFTEEEDPALFHHVNVISGNLNLSVHDATVKGAEPLILKRTYSSSGALERGPGDYDLRLKELHNDWLIQGGWSFLPHINLLIEPAHNQDLFKAYLPEKSGGMITYIFDHKDDKSHCLWMKPDRNLGQSSGSLSARTNPQNNRLFLELDEGRATLMLPDGSKRTYLGRSLKYYKTRKGQEPVVYVLTGERLPNQNYIYYHRDAKGHLGGISTFGPPNSKTKSKQFITGRKLNWAHFHLKGHGDMPFSITTSDGDKIDYIFKQEFNRYYLNQVNNTAKATEASHYTFGREGIGQRIEEFYIAGKVQFRASYIMPPGHDDKNIDKVSQLEARVGKNDAFMPIARFAYFPDYTEVRDVDNLKIVYRHNGANITSIDYYNSDDQLESSQKFYWMDHRLQGKAYTDEKGRGLFSKTFHYDALGNVTEEIFYGNLTGSQEETFPIEANGKLTGADSFRKRFEYLPHFNVPTLIEEEGGLNYRFLYKPATDLVTKKLTCAKDKILIREFINYDNNHFIVEEIKDDGNSDDINNLSRVTQRLIKKYEHTQKGLPLSLTESYLDLSANREVLIKKTVNHYSEKNQITQEDIYDASSALRYSLKTEYNAHGQVISKSDPLGQISTYAYDDQGNLIKSKEVGKPEISFGLDHVGKPTEMRERFGGGINKITRFNYDPKGHLLSQIDHKNKQTDQDFDNFGRCLKTTFGEKAAIHFTYDRQGNVASSTAPLGETTATIYNTYRKPIKIIQPDGVEIRHLYNKTGSLVQTTHTDGSYVEYTYDAFQRLTSKTTYTDEGAALSTESWTYTAFNQISHTNPNGLTTKFIYDGAGRKTAEKAEDRKISYEYDSLGFQSKTNIGTNSQVQLHDIAGRVIEQWTEYGGKKENRMLFFYDKNNRKEKAIRFTSQGEAHDSFTYDVQGRLICHTDPLGAKTEFIYDDNFENEQGQKVLQKTIIDPIGNRTIETYDVLNKLVRLQKQNPGQTLISQEDYIYDLSGNQIERISSVFNGDKPIRKISVSWEYDSCGRVIREIEGGEKTTTNSYNQRGQLASTTKPDGTTLYFFYDALERLFERYSSDGSIHDKFIYSQGSKPTELKDLAHFKTIQRTYNLFEELIEEISPEGQHSFWEYDSQGRCARCIFPEQSSIKYTYNGPHLAKVQRFSASGESLYEHAYTEFDQNGHVSREELINDLGRIETAHDLLERPFAQNSKWLEQSLEFGPSGLVIQKRNSLLGDKHYDYDGLNQIQKEGEKAYQFDSVGNPYDCTINDLNQILTTPTSNLAYDSNGNPTQKVQDQETISYGYDALGRLISIKSENRIVEYTYDPESRLHSKVLTAFENGIWQEPQTLYYLYDRDLEIGTITTDGRIQQLKILGLGLKGDIGAAIALELNNQIFAPLHDFTGNIIAIIDKKGAIAESYNHDAFGNDPASSIHKNPWRFVSKRSEEGLVYFHFRFYSPDLGRWLTPDPSGFTDGPNLYNYVLNNPLSRLDLFGLLSEANSIHSITSIEIQSMYLNIDPYSKNAPFLIEGALKFDGHEIGKVVCSANWLRLNFSPEELRVGTINLLDHFGDFMPKEGSFIAVASLQNGINTDLPEFHQMGYSLLDKLPSGMLFMGLHNPSQGLFKDIPRAKALMRGPGDTSSVIVTRQFMLAIQENLYKINPELLWMHVTHSEGGALAYRAIEGMRPQEIAMLRQQLISFNIGPALAIPDYFAKFALSIYSNKDFVTMPHNRKLLHDSNYNIEILESISLWYQMTLFFADHAYFGRTYQMASKNTLDDFETNYGFLKYESR